MVEQVCWVHDIDRYCSLACYTKDVTPIQNRSYAVILFACCVVKNTKKTSIPIRLYSLMFAPFDRILIAGYIKMGNPWTLRGSTFETAES